MMVDESRGGWTYGELRELMDEMAGLHRSCMPGYDRFVGLALAGKAGAPFDRRELDRALFGMRPVDWLPYALDHLHLFPRPGAARLLAKAVAAAEHPSSFGPDRMVAALRGVGFAADAAGLGPPTDLLTVFRGGNEANGWRNVAWTTDESVAGWYAERLAMHTAACVYEAEVDPPDVLGRLVDDAVVLVNPAGLRSVRAIRRFETPAAEDG